MVTNWSSNALAEKLGQRIKLLLETPSLVGATLPYSQSQMQNVIKIELYDTRVRVLLLVLFTALRCAHKADIPHFDRLLRNRILHFLARGLVTSLQFSKKKIGICSRSRASILYRAQSFDMHSEYISY